MENTQLSALESDLEKLILEFRQLREELADVKRKQSALLSERVHLTQKNKTARTKINELINRLELIEET